LATQDPIAAILISLYIMINWITTGLEHIDMVVGKSANAIFLRKLIFLAMNHHEVRLLSAYSSRIRGNQKPSITLDL
jgi:divalent metal cation (Fe/Co/Zn/Cd) transporter